MENKTPEKYKPNAGYIDQPDSYSKDSYYKSGGMKVADFFIGFLGTTIISFALGVIFMNILARHDELMAIYSLVKLAAYIYLVVYFFKKKRRYIAIGMLSTLLIPLLFFGACLIIIITMYGM